jgi:7,8-dihydropterin-6-yl-methyl-4-(beta-D-ribofuranosyl)aminobenzene 5'-phosphate synthase
VHTIRPARIHYPNDDAFFSNRSGKKSSNSASCRNVRMQPKSEIIANADWLSDFSMIEIVILIVSLLAAILAFVTYLVIRFNRGKRRAEEEWQRSKVQKITQWGATKSLVILPLVDWYTSTEDLKGEAGVSYLVKTDNKTILFDVGFNAGRNDPSPLLHNMEQLGLTQNDFDTIVISHNHLDHVGGSKWQRRNSFSLSNRQVDLGEKSIYTPEPMSYPGLSPVYAEKPTVIGQGMATIGAIANQDFFLGRIQEQAVAVNVAGRGVVLIVGCGHQTLPRIIERAEALFEEPIYGIVGGLHYPVTDSRARVMGFGIQKYLGTCRFPWKPITMAVVRENIAFLKERNPGIVAISAHDSCDASIAGFQEAFQDAFREIKVGLRIVI